MRHQERKIHILIADWLLLALPQDAVAFHVPNGEYRKPETAALLKRMLVVAGIPDFLIFWQGRALAIEVKAPGGRVSPAQIEMAQRLQRAGVTTTIVYKIEAVEQFLRSVGMPLRASMIKGRGDAGEAVHQGP